MRMTRFQIRIRQIQIRPATARKGVAVGPREGIVDTVHFTNKGRLMDTIERFYIFRETKQNNQINDRLTVKPNIIFETIVREDPHRGIYNTCSTQ